MESGVDFAALTALTEEEMKAVGGAGTKELADRVYRK
jgi:hypothetical protein